MSGSHVGALPAPLGPLSYPLGLTDADFAAARPATAPTQLPRLTVVTPSYNQGDYLEMTLRSVLGQGYPNLEYFVMDGGSTDHSAGLIRHYAPWLSGWVSERDQGQTDAIAKGLERATGDWFVWINSDDLLAPGALWAVARSDADCDVLAGLTVEYQGDRHVRTVDNSRLGIDELLTEEVWHQPSVWMRPTLMREIGLDHGLQYRFDYFLMLRYLQHHPRIRLLPDKLAYFRLHNTSKTMAGKRRFIAEMPIGLRQLMNDPAFAGRRAQLDHKARVMEWRGRLEEIAADGARPRLARIREMLREVGVDRPARCTATTRRALIRLLLRGGQRRRKPGRSL